MSHRNYTLTSLVIPVIIIQLSQPSLWRCGHAALHPSRPPWHNQYCPSHDLGSSSFTYSDWQVCKQKAPFILQLTNKLRGFLIFQISGLLCGFFFSVLTNAAQSKLLGSLSEGDSFGSPGEQGEAHSELATVLQSQPVILQLHTGQSWHDHPDQTPELLE